MHTAAQNIAIFKRFLRELGRGNVGDPTPGFAALASDSIWAPWRSIAWSMEKSSTTRESSSPAQPALLGPDDALRVLINAGAAD